MVFLGRRSPVPILSKNSPSPLQQPRAYGILNLPGNAGVRPAESMGMASVPNLRLNKQCIPRQQMSVKAPRLSGGIVLSGYCQDKPMVQE